MGSSSRASDLTTDWFDAAAELRVDFAKTWADTIEEMIEHLTRVQGELSQGAISDDEAVLRDLGAFGAASGAGTVTAAAALYLAARYAAQPTHGILRAAFTHELTPTR